MKILLLGATGRTGRELLTQALDAGLSVNALVRDPARVGVASANLTLFESPILDKPALRTALNGCDAVLSTLNIARTSEFPWSRLRTPPDFLSTTLRHLLDVAPELGVRRIILTTAWGVSETRDDLPAWFRWLIDSSNLGPAYRDHEKQERLLAASSLDWTVVRPVVLTNGRKAKPIRVTIDHRPKPNLTISRYNVARFMLDLYRTPSHLKEAVTISEA